MADVISRGELFPVSLIPNMMNMVKGHSAIAKLCGQSPIAFNGQREFTFTMDKDVDIVAENGAKGKGGVTVTPVTIVPIKFEYGARVSDEFRYGSDEVRLQYLTAFAEGFARKIARGLDIAAFHGLNPRSVTASAVVGTNNFDSAVTANKIVYGHDSSAADVNLQEAIDLITATDGAITGMALSPAFAAAMGALSLTGGAWKYPGFQFGAKPDAFYGIPVDINPTVAVHASGATQGDEVIVGDFQNCFKWGYSKEIPLEVIEYGNPDNDGTLGDLKGHNQVYLRAEAYIGWGILDATAFARVYTANP